MAASAFRIVAGKPGFVVGLLLLNCANVLGFEHGEMSPDRDRTSTTLGDAGTAFEPGAGSASNAGAAGSRSSVDDDSGGKGGGADGSDGGVGEGGAGARACDNGRIDPGEECDGLDLGEATCATLSRANAVGGRLGCTSQCQYDIDECYQVRSLDLMLHVCAVLSNGRLKCWGPNFSGQLGLGDTEARGDTPDETGAGLPFVELGGARVVDVTTGFEHSCALLEGDKVKCWGSNAFGQLGVPGEQVLEPSSAPAIDLGVSGVTSVVAGGYHNCALFDSGRVKCWGRNDHGQLGLGHSRDRGALASEMGENLPFVDLGTTANGAPVEAYALALGFDHTCVLTMLGTVKCWGSNIEGQSGIPASVENLGDSPSDLGNNLKAIKIAGMVERLSAGSWHNCASTSALSLNCWGTNDGGQLGVKAQFPLLDVSLGSGLYIDGITTGEAHTCAWFAFGGLKCWGTNESGQLGLGDTDGRGLDPKQMGDNLPFVNLGTGVNVSSVHAGYGSTCAILKGRLKCWGWNSLGTLGAGHTEPVGTTPESMGDNLPFVAL